MTGRRRRVLPGWLAAQAVSLAGTRISMVALPWFVLTTTGSATRTGLVAFAEMAPYVVAKAAAGPWVDRVGARRVCVGADLASVVVVGAIPLLHGLGLLSFPALLALVAVAGALRGPSDGARQALVPVVVAASGVPLERATGLGGAVERLASTVGAAAAAGLVAVLGPVTALVADAATFAASAALLAATVPRSEPRTRDRSQPGGYVAELHEGWRFLRSDPVLVAMVTMIALTNLLDTAYAAVLVPVWAAESGRGAAAIGLLFATFSAAALAGSLAAAWLGDRLPRLATYTLAFLLGGFPRFLVLALDLPLPTVLSVAALSGLGVGFLNPILGAVIFERIPAHLVGRVTALQTSLCWAGIPFGGLLAGLLVSGAGLPPALLVAGGAYLAATLLPLVTPAWRHLDDGRLDARRGAEAPAGAA